MSRKDSKGMFAAVLGQLDSAKATEGATPRSSSPHLLKVAEGVRQMQERSELADKLLKNGEQIIELAPGDILASTIHDRFDSAYDHAAIAELVESMRVRGQIVPGLVRPLSDGSGRFQIVYGRRRLAAAKQLGIKFKAAIRELTDEQAVIYQGEENTAREDLSFIEKCLFALSQSEAGFSRETICASLSTGKSHISEMIKITSSVPKSLILAIGAAPGIGRGRWDEFSKRFAFIGAANIAENIISSESFSTACSDDRFSLVLNSLPTEASTSTNTVQSVKNSTGPALWVASDKSIKISIKDNGKISTLAIGARDGPQFAKFLTTKLDELYNEFSQDKAVTGV